VPGQIGLAKKEPSAPGALEPRWVVVDDVAIGRGVVADGAERALRRRIEFQKGVPAG
jgi:hypothetical protein